MNCSLCVGVDSGPVFAETLLVEALMILLVSGSAFCGTFFPAMGWKKWLEVRLRGGSRESVSLRPYLNKNGTNLTEPI